MDDLQQLKLLAGIGNRAVMQTYQGYPGSNISVTGNEKGPPAIEHSFSGFGFVDPDRGLVWLQRHECADPGQNVRSGGGQFADGHGRRNPGGLGHG